MLLQAGCMCVCVLLVRVKVGWWLRERPGGQRLDIDEGS